MIHLATILQFVTDQLRDAPTQDSALFLYIFFWMNNFSKLIASSINVPVLDVIILFDTNAFGEPKTALTESVARFSLLSSLLALIITHKHKSWSMTEKIRTPIS